MSLKFDDPNKQTPEQEAARPQILKLVYSGTPEDQNAQEDQEKDSQPLIPDDGVIDAELRKGLEELLSQLDSDMKKFSDPSVDQGTKFNIDEKWKDWIQQYGEFPVSYLEGVGYVEVEGIYHIPLIKSIRRMLQGAIERLL